jgi:hypothetical protein
MYKIKTNEEIWQRIIEWSQEKYRYRTFVKYDKIPTRPKILYLVNQGTVKLMANYQLSVTSNSEEDNSDRPEASLIDFIRPGQPFEIFNESTCEMNAYAQMNGTSVLWMYWYELENWPNFNREILKAFRDREQRKLVMIAILTQRRTIDRLYGFLRVLIEEHGIAYIKKSQSNQGYSYYLPWTMTHAEIASAIASTRVTVTRLMGELREQGLIDMYRNQYICLPPKIEENAHQ